MLDQGRIEPEKPTEGILPAHTTTPTQLCDLIVLRIGQRGAVGLSERTLKIGIDGAWSTSYDINSQPGQVSQSGNLSPEQIREIVRVLAIPHHGYNIEALPPEIGHRTLNPSIAVISSGQTTITSFIKMGSSQTQGKPQALAFEDIVMSILKIVGIGTIEEIASPVPLQLETNI